jgi:hypothetical protein
MNIQIQVQSELFEQDLNALSNYLNRDLGREAYEFFRAATPVRSGNARARTIYIDQGDSKRIEALYPYAKRLNEGWSTQAPVGMVAPTQEFIERQVDREIRGL